MSVWKDIDSMFAKYRANCGDLASKSAVALQGLFSDSQLSRIVAQQDGNGKWSVEIKGRNSERWEHRDRLLLIEDVRAWAARRNAKKAVTP